MDPGFSSVTLSKALGTRLINCQASVSHYKGKRIKSSFKQQQPWPRDLFRGWNRGGFVLVLRTLHVLQQFLSFIITKITRASASLEFQTQCFREFGNLMKHEFLKLLLRQKKIQFNLIFSSQVFFVHLMVAQKSRNTWACRFQLRAISHLFVKIIDFKPSVFENNVFKLQVWNFGFQTTCLTPRVFI